MSTRKDRVRERARLGIMHRTEVKVRVRVGTSVKVRDIIRMSRMGMPTCEHGINPSRSTTSTTGAHVHVLVQ